MTDDNNNSKAVIDRRIKELDDKIKERETSKFRALKTLYEDTIAYRSGETSRPPTSAAFGLINSFFFSTFALITLSFVGSVVAVLQITVLIHQNKLMKQQNELIDIQTSANQIEAVSSLLSSANEGNNNESVLAQMVVYARDSFDVIYEMSRQHTETGREARLVLSRASSRLSDRQAAAVFVNNLHHYAVELVAAAGGNRFNDIRALSYPNSAAASPRDVLRSTDSVDMPSYINMQTYQNWGPDIIFSTGQSHTPQRLLDELFIISEFSLLSQYIANRHVLFRANAAETENFKLLDHVNGIEFVKNANSASMKYLKIIIDSTLKSGIHPLSPSSPWSSVEAESDSEAILTSALRDTLAHVNSICHFTFSNADRALSAAYKMLGEIVTTNNVVNSKLRGVSLDEWLTENCSI